MEAIVTALWTFLHMFLWYFLEGQVGYLLGECNLTNLTIFGYFVDISRWIDSFLEEHPKREGYIWTMFTCVCTLIDGGLVMIHYEGFRL
jgi:hypothetical protein